MTLLEALGICHELAVENQLERKHVDPELYDEVDRQDEALRLVDDLLTNHADLVSVNVSWKEELDAYPLLDDDPDADPGLKYFCAAPSGSGIVIQLDPALNLEHEKLPPRLDLENHSPTGFAWGYNGSGPAQLALAILAHHFRGMDNSPTQADRLAVEYHQAFKADYVASVPRTQNFEINTAAIDQWLKGQHEAEA